MHNPEYRLVAGKYVLHDGDDAIGTPMDEIALCFDSDTGTLHEHGAPFIVAAWHNHARQALKDSAPRMANDLVLLTGKLDVEEVNRCISTVDYAKRYYAKLSKMMAAGEGISGPTQLQGS